MGSKGRTARMGRNEEIADSRGDADEPLQASWRSKALHCLLSPAQRQMRILCPVIRAFVRAVLNRRHDLASRGCVGAELVGDHPTGQAALLLRQPICCPCCLFSLLSSSTPLSFRKVLSIERMEVADHLVQAGGIQMGVDLSGLDASMPQQLLQHAQVRAA